MKTNIAIDDIILDPRCQPRTEMDPQLILDYVEAMRDGATFPPVIVYHDESDYYLADGFHRVEAARLADTSEIACDVRRGGLRDAILHAVGANAAHGKRRTNADKRRAVEVLLGDDEWQEWSDREIARRCEVTHPFVARVRRELSGNGYQPESWVTTVPGFISYTVYPGDPDRTTQSVHDAVRVEHGRKGLIQFRAQMSILGAAFTKVNRLVGEERFQAWLTAWDEVEDEQFLPAFLYAWANDTLETFVVEHPTWRIVKDINGAVPAP